MSRKQCKRKVYPLCYDTMRFVKEGVSVTPADLLDQLTMRDLSSLDAMAHGRGTLQEWTDLKSTMNVSEHMAMNGVGPEALPFCRQLEAELIDAAHRFERTRTMGLTGAGIQAARHVIEYSQLQRSSITRKEYEKFILSTLDRIRSQAPEVISLQTKETA